jgi:molecular chaperone HtpG
MTQHAFQTEVTQLLHLMIHSLYSQRDIFLRELVSNASDACDKLRFKALTNADLLKGGEELAVTVTADAEAKTLTITDTGIGMTEAEAVEHLGTIAKSGTKAFLQNMGDQAKDSNLIGQFGVGFYSAFMVADRIVVESRSATASSDAGVRWESRGDGSFTTESIARTARGTTITLHLKDDATEFTGNWKLRELIKKYSDYVAYPIKLPKYLSDEEKQKGATAELEQVNAGQPLWTRPKDQLTDELYDEFYKSACKQWDEPATRLHITVEGTLSFTALLFIPSTKPFDLFERDRRGLSLYVRRVFIMDDCKDLLPEYLRFVRGVIDSDDLPLNVSREILQQQDTVQKIKKQLVKRILDHLVKLSTSTDDKDKAAWTAIENTFGQVLREGVVNDHENKDRIAKLMRFRSTWTEAPAKEGETKTEKTGFEGYISRMPEGQKAIYYVIGSSLAAAQASPHIEGFAKKGYEVLFLTDAVDEWVVGHLHEFDKKPLSSVQKGEADLASAEDKEKLEAQAKSWAGFMGFCKESLGEGVSEVRLSSRLTDSPCCLVGGEHGLSPQMEEIMRRMGQDVPVQKRVLELNAEHPLVARLQSAFDGGTDKTALKGYVELLRDQALIADGARLDDAAGFAKRVQAVLAAALPGKAAGAAG